MSSRISETVFRFLPLLDPTVHYKPFINMVLKYYYDLLSQPCRAVYIFLKVNNIEFEPNPVALTKGEHRGETFKKVNPFSQVPVIDDDGFVLTESVAILKYLTYKYSIDDHWYPRNDLQVQAKIDQYMNWQHFNTRPAGAFLFQNLLLIPMKLQKPIDFKAVEKYKKKTSESVKHMEDYFLKSNMYLCGRDISLADLLGVCELMQLYAVYEEKVWESNHVVKAWMDRVKDRLQPHFDEAHQITYRTRENYKTLGPQLAKL